MTQHTKGTEKIMNEMLDKLRKNESYKKHLQELHEKEAKKNRKRRRGPKVYVYSKMGD